MIFGTPTDAEVIERVRRAERLRKRIAGVLITVGLAGLAFTVYMAYRIHISSLASLNQFSQLSQPTPQQSCQLLNEMYYQRGILIGAALIGGFSTFFSFALNGFMKSFRNRTHQLLLRCWDVLTLDDEASPND